MAAAMEISTPTLKPADILHEVRSFLKCCSSPGEVQTSPNITKSALFLLQTLPTARHAVLEYYANIFDDAVNDHFMRLMLADQGQNKNISAATVYENVIQEVCGVLFNFIKTNAAAWGSVVSEWSLNLLGHISKKYAPQRSGPQGNSLNENVQQWLNCSPTKALMEVTTECFGAMVKTQPEMCVDKLLEASVQFSPHFDWVVAHIGSCYPDAIITRVLLCGLNDFCQQENKVSTDLGLAENVPKMASVVGILGHLASQHGQDIKMALMKLLMDSLESSNATIKVSSVPFLLQLLSMSPPILQIITPDLISALTPDVLRKLNQTLGPWREANRTEFESLLSLLVHLFTLVEAGSLSVIQFLLDAAYSDGELSQSKYDPSVREICTALITRLAVELQKSIFHKQGDGNGDVPLLASLTPKVIEITDLLLNSEGQRARSLVQLLSYIGLYGGEDSAADLLAHIMIKAKNQSQLKMFMELQLVMEAGLGDILQRTNQKLMGVLQPPVSSCPQGLLKNILIILQQEKASSNTKVVRSTLSHYIREHWESLIPLLSHADLSVSITTVKIFNVVGVSRPLAGDTALRMSSAIVIVVFRCLQLTEARKAQQSLFACKKCLRQLVKQGFVQFTLLRFMIEGVVSKEVKYLFGGKYKSEDKEEDGFSPCEPVLLEDNYKHGATLTLMRSHSSVFHAGVIGSGLRPEVKGGILKPEHLLRNRRCLMDILNAISSAPGDVSTSTNQIQELNSKRLPLVLSEDLCRMIGGLITELTTPDVLYNNRFWPEEESIRFTVERDLFVWKKFEDNPILWDILDLYSGNSLVICRCSAVVKSLTASLMNYFEGCHETKAVNSPKQSEAACRLIRCLAKSQLLPEPLRYVSELFPLISAHSAYLVLLTVWKYIKEYPPTEDPEEVRRRVCEARHVDPIRHILHCNIDTLGHLYDRFFLSVPKPEPKLEPKVIPVIPLEMETNEETQERKATENAQQEIIIPLSPPPRTDSPPNSLESSKSLVTISATDSSQESPMDVSADMAGNLTPASLSSVNNNTNANISAAAPPQLGNNMSGSMSTVASYVSGSMNASFSTPPPHNTPPPHVTHTMTGNLPNPPSSQPVMMASGPRHIPPNFLQGATSGFNAISTGQSIYANARPSSVYAMPSQLRPTLPMPVSFRPPPMFALPNFSSSQMLPMSMPPRFVPTPHMSDTDLRYAQAQSDQDMRVHTPPMGRDTDMRQYPQGEDYDMRLHSPLDTDLRLRGHPPDVDLRKSNQRN